MNYRQSNPVGEGLVEAPTELEAVEMLRRDAVAKEQADRLVRKKLWGQGHGAIRKAQAVEDHAGCGFSGRDLLLVIVPKACVDHLNEAQVLDDARNDSSMV